jgi:hypothetical protein
MFILQKAAAEYTTGYGAKRKTKPALAGLKHFPRRRRPALPANVKQAAANRRKFFSACLKTQSLVYCQ